MYSLSGFRLVTRPGVRLYIVVPLFINTIIFSLIILFGVNELSEFITWIEAQWQWLSWISWLLWPLFFILVLTLLFFSFAVVANLIAAPFNGLLSEVVEQELCKMSGSPQSSTGITTISFKLILSSVSSEVRKFLYIMLRLILLLIIFVIPVVQIIAPLIWFIFAAWVMALEYMEYPLGNHGNDFHDVRAIIADHRNLSMGFGLGISLLTIIPLINFIAMPVAVSGATKMYFEKLHKE